MASTCCRRASAILLLLTSLVSGRSTKVVESLPRIHEQSYSIISRRAFERNSGGPSDARDGADAEDLPRFDGELEAILDLAMEKALKQEGLFPNGRPSTPVQPTPAPTSGDSLIFGPGGVGSGSDRPSLVPSAAPSSAGGIFGGTGRSDGPSLVPSVAPTNARANFTEMGGSDAPSLTPSIAPSTSPFGTLGQSDYPSLVPAGWPISSEPVLSIPSGVPSDAPSVTPTRVPVEEPRPLGTATPNGTPPPTITELLNPHSCDADSGGDSMSATYLMTINFAYSLETTASANIRTVIGETEEILQETMARRVLSCLNSKTSNASIVALDSLPRDWVAAQQTCSPSLDSENACDVIQGSMRFFLSKSGAAQTATNLVARQLADILNSMEFVRKVGTGLLRSQLLRADTQAPAVVAVGENGEPPREPTTVETEKSATPVVLVTVAGAALVVLVASVYFWKRTYNRNVPSAATEMAGSSFNGAGDLSSSAPSSNSPFSEMVPDSYRFNGNMSVMSGQGGGGMTAILEDEEVTVHSQTSSAIFMSETGYSEQAGETDTSLMSFDIPKSLYTRVPESPNLLGARKRNQEHIMVTDSGEDTSVSDIESSSGLDDASPDSPVARHGALPNASTTMTSLLDDSELVPPRIAARPQLVDASADDSMHADELLLFC